MKLKQKLVVILPILILCLIVVYYITYTRHKTTEIPLETKVEESSTAPTTTNETKVVTSSKSPESNTTAPSETTTLSPEDISIIEGIINNQNTSVFKGNAGKQNIYMAIFRNENKLSASYVTSYDDTETHLTGSIDVNSASFALSNEDGSITFQGLIKPGTQKGDLLAVDYKNTKDNMEVNFDLSLSHSFASSSQERYLFAEASTEDVENFAKNIKLYITSDKKKELAEMIQYPINVTIHDAKKTINSSDEFIQSYDDIITADFKDKISKSYTRYLFSNDKGIMMGNGEIWIHSLNDKGLRIFAINN